LLITESGYGKRTQLTNFARKGRGGLGMIGIKLTGKKGSVVAAFMVGLEDDVVVVASGGTTIRTPVKEISSQGRAATGVRIMSLGAGQVVASAALVLAHDEE
jgi:DNA gyrase subunit A